MKNKQYYASRPTWSWNVRHHTFFLIICHSVTCKKGINDLRNIKVFLKFTIYKFYRPHIVCWCNYWKLYKETQTIQWGWNIVVLHFLKQTKIFEIVHQPYRPLLLIVFRSLERNSDFGCLGLYQWCQVQMSLQTNSFTVKRIGGDNRDTDDSFKPGRIVAV